MPQKPNSTIIYSGAFERFRLIIERTNELLGATTIGIDNKLEQTRPLLEKFEEIKIPRGRLPKNYDPVIRTEIVPNSSMLKLEIDERSAVRIRKVLEFDRKKTQELRFHQNSVMLVYVWGSFETYLLMLFEEIFTKRPEMLKSSESISYRIAIENQKNIVEYLVQNELDKIGHFSLEEYLKYISNKININLQKKTQERLRSIYLLRNIIAHNTGLVAARLKVQLPKSVKIINGELRITDSYLTNEIKFLQSVVVCVEKIVNLKFNKKKQ